jgi:hypothetical protein
MFSSRNSLCDFRLLGRATRRWVWVMHQASIGRGAATLDQAAPNQAKRLYSDWKSADDGPSEMLVSFEKPTGGSRIVSDLESLPNLSCSERAPAII